MRCSARPPWGTSASITPTPTRNGAGSTAAGCSPRSSTGSRARGWRPVNCDLIIHAQEPKLGPHKPALRANIARLLGVSPTAVNVKAKTGEHVGPIGRAEAIACEAVVLIERVPEGLEPGPRIAMPGRRVEV